MKKINEHISSELFKEITGLKTSGPNAPDPLTDLMLSAFGTSSKATKTNVDTAKIAKSLGVSRTTVYNWLSGKSKPRPSSLKKLQTKARQARTTKRGRAAAIKRTHFATSGAQITIKGVQGPEAGKGYVRNRVCGFPLTNPEQLDAFFDAWIENGEKGALQYLEDNPEIYGMDRWHFEEVDKVNITGLFSNR